MSLSIREDVKDQDTIVEPGKLPWKGFPLTTGNAALEIQYPFGSLDVMDGYPEANNIITEPDSIPVPAHFHAASQFTINLSGKEYFSEVTRYVKSDKPEARFTAGQMGATYVIATYDADADRTFDEEQNAFPCGPAYLKANPSFVLDNSKE